MHTLDKKSVLVLTSTGTPVSIGRFAVVKDAVLNTEHVELCFETEQLSCRLRINGQKIGEIKRTWNGEMFAYSLPAGDAVWLQQPPSSQ